MTRPPDHLVILEIAYTGFEDSCREPHVELQGTIRQCRRFRGHADEHASDYPLVYWS